LTGKIDTEKGIEKMPKGAFTPFYFHTYDCSCGWQKIGDKRTVDLATKLHLKHTHADQKVEMLVSADTQRVTRSDGINRPKPVMVRKDIQGM